MKFFASLLLAALALSACNAIHRQGEPTGERRVRFVCENGEALEMRFFPLQGVGVLVRNGETIELQERPVASGFLYSNGPLAVRGKGDELMLEIGRRVPIRCQAGSP